MESSPGGDGSSNATPTSKSRGAQHLEEIEDLTVNLFLEQINVGSNANQPKRQSKKETTSSQARCAPRKMENWTIKEDEALVSGYINAGGDVGDGTTQTKIHLWNNIAALYEQTRLGNPKDDIKQRTMKALQVRWDTINGTVGKWVMCYSECQRGKPSGMTEEDVEGAAHESYEKLHGQQFMLMHCWKHMRKKQKWGAGTMVLPTCSQGSSKRGEPEYVRGESSESRPDGAKKAKKKGKTVAPTDSSAIDFETLTYTLNEISDTTYDQGERMYDLIRKRSDERKRQKEEEAKLRIYSILASNPNRDSEDEKAYKKLKDEFKGRYY
ncbi:glutathione S-transferase T3-like [Chenopodium quinoa]|uniref:glutathione S-transferase T3-like n=1 Tax=Chenopodium quinoa TaxID=63459 RepID=UPI000B780D83|nr:glutathione S-transferase T3-like [Chenopodium quinoa]